MDAKLLVESKMMVSEAFGIGDVPREPLVTISKVTIEAQDKEGKEKWGLLYFSEPWAKPLKINRHSQKCCIAMFGGNTDQWIGKRLSLYSQPGTYFGERGTAVRIKGSPDLAAPLSVAVKKRSSKTPDIYNLIPTPAANGANKNAHNHHPPAPFVSDGTVRIGAKKGTQIAQLTHDEIAAAVALGTKQITEAKPGAPWVPNAQAHLDELLADQRRRADLEKQMDGPQTAATEDAPF